MYFFIVRPVLPVEMLKLFEDLLFSNKVTVDLTLKRMYMMLGFIQSMNVFFINFIEFPQFFILVLEFIHSVLKHFDVEFGAFFCFGLFIFVNHLPLLFDLFIFICFRVFITPIASKIKIWLRLQIDRFYHFLFELVHIFIRLALIKKWN